ncbi:hypothetical protein Q6D67_05150 [Haliea sp. E1-2-M8]|uniref:hypothetical protein n=1 Tax=Haliea sp. E1-2-M8 TaxID=3064706 RepID=UPI00271A3B94|nr:hypothetical protein [Haliea sp. E1-2-M8]MDO8861084.1 hypothetical protein [Haliea sp. E1-2-M8]
MKTSNKCHQSYNHGLAERGKYAFYDGSGYKIKEAYCFAQDLPRNLKAIGINRASKGRIQTDIQHCLPYEAHTWVKKLPESLCRELAFNVVGAIEALSRDGVSPSKIKIIRGMLSSWTPHFITRADAARLHAKSSWKTTVLDLRAGVGPVHELIEDFLIMMEWLMEEAGIDDDL